MIEFCVSRVPGCCDALEDNDNDMLETLSCKVAEPIAHNLILTEQVAGSAGRAVIDEEGYDWDVIQVTTSLYDYLKPRTSIVEHSDRVRGTYRARVSKFKIKVTQQIDSKFSARSTIELRKPR